MLSISDFPLYESLAHKLHPSIARSFQIFKDYALSADGKEAGMIPAMAAFDCVKEAQNRYKVGFGPIYPTR